MRRFLAYHVFPNINVYLIKIGFLVSIDVDHDENNKPAFGSIQIWRIPK